VGESLIPAASGAPSEVEPCGHVADAAPGHIRKLCHAHEEPAQDGLGNATLARALSHESDVQEDPEDADCRSAELAARPLVRAHAPCACAAPRQDQISVTTSAHGRRRHSFAVMLRQQLAHLQIWPLLEDRLKRAS
jgi:hypothetical protein